MVPLKLSLKNFLSYGEETQTLDFRNFEIACLTGKNGHGKSALIDSITWALWGKCRVKIKDEVIKRGASEASVELEFESDNNIYRILRTIQRKKTGTSTSVHLSILDTESGSFNALDEGSKTQFTLENLLKMDYNSFICSSFILQGMADEFTKRTPSERKEVLSKILALDEYELLTKKARERSQTINMELSALENEIENLESEISEKDLFERKLKEAKTEEAKVTQDITKFESIHENLIKQNEETKAKLLNLNKLEKEKEENDQKCSFLDSELKELRAQILKNKKVVAREKEIVEGFNNYETVKKQLEILSKKELAKLKLETDLETYQNLIKSEKSKLTGEINSLKVQGQEIEKNLLHVKSVTTRENEIINGLNKFEELNSLSKVLEKKMLSSQKLQTLELQLNNKIEQSKVTLQASEKVIREKALILKTRSQEKNRLEKEIENLTIKINKTKQEQAKLEEAKSNLGKRRELSSSLSSAILDLKKRRDEETTKLSVIKTELNDPHCPLCESPLKEEAKQALVEKLETLTSELVANIAKHDQELRKNNLKIDQLVSDLVKLESATKNSSILIKELGEKEQNLKDAETASREFENTKKDLQNLTKSIKDKEYLKEFSQSLNELQKKKSELDYDSKYHESVRQETEEFRKYVTENEILQKEKKRGLQYEKLIKELLSKIAPLKEALKEENYSLVNRKEVQNIITSINTLSYNEDKHTELKENADKLIMFVSEKQALSSAKLSLELREEEEKKMNSELINEKKKSEIIQKELGQMKEINSRSLEINKQLESSASRLAILKKNKNELLSELSRTENHLERIEKLIKTKKDVTKKIIKSNRELVIFKELVKAYGKNGLQALIIENAVPEIEIEANKILTKLTDGTMVVSLDMIKPTQTGGTKETLEIYISDSSGTRSYETFSGGEAFRIDFALRVAISKFIANRSGAQLRTLVVDEGFGTQDKDGLDQFVQVINTVKEDFDKILAITHVEELKERFPVRIEVTKEPGLGSRFEVIYT